MTKKNVDWTKLAEMRRREDLISSLKDRPMTCGTPFKKVPKRELVTIKKTMGNDLVVLRVHTSDRTKAFDVAEREFGTDVKLFSHDDFSYDFVPVGRKSIRMGTSSVSDFTNKLYSKTEFRDEILSDEERHIISQAAYVERMKEKHRGHPLKEEHD